MASTTQVTDFSDLYTDLLNRILADTSVTATVNQAKRYINIALHDMHLGFEEKFTWAERSAILRTQAEYTTGTISITKGSTTLTGSGTSWNTNNDFSVANVRTTGRFVPGGSEEIYDIASVDSDTQVTLSTAFIGETLSGATYRYFEDEYALDADFLRPLDVQSFDEAREIEILSRTEFRRRYPRSNTTGRVKIATIVDRAFSGSTTPVRRVRFWKPPSDVQLIPYNFVTNKLAVTSAGVEQTQLSSDDDEPIVPLQYRHAIVFHALYHWYRDKKNDDRAQEAKTEYTDLILRIVSNQEIGSRRPKIEPRKANYVARAKRPYRRRSSRYVTGTRFDEIR